MASLPEKADVLLIGHHPSALLAAVLLRQKSKLTVVHVAPPGPGDPDRLVRINPDFFALHPVLAPLKRKIAQTVLYGIQFLSADGQTRSEWRERSTVVTTASLKQVGTALTKLAGDHGVHLCHPRSLAVDAIDEHGADVRISSTAMRARAIIIADTVDPEQHRLLNIPSGQDDEMLHRLSWVRIKGKTSVDLGTRPLAMVSLDLLNQQAIGWLLPGKSESQLMLIQPVALARQEPPPAGLRQWANVLVQHGVLTSENAPEWGKVKSMDIPLAGALAREGVANRTLLIGPAGGFFSASGEDIHPNCWSAVHAAEVMKKSLREPHLQDALGAYRARWRTTLGDYLRGPQQNLRFLLPLVYRNPVMTQRLGEAILLGRSIVR